MRIYHTLGGRSMLLWIIFSWPLFLLGQQFPQQSLPGKELVPVSSTYAIINANVTQGPGRKIEGATVVIKNGLIMAVGKNVSVPPESIIIKGDSLYVYAGFIDGLSHAGISKPKEENNQNRERPKDPGNPSAEAAGILPQNDVRSFLNPAEKSIEELRAAGFTAGHVVPYGTMLPGNGAIILFSGKTVDGAVLVGKSSLFSELAGAQRVYPSTSMAVMAKWRELYWQAIQAKNYENLYATNRTGLNRPASDRVLEAFYPVIDKKIPVLFEADRYLDIQRILALQSDLGFSLILADVKEGWDAIPKIKSVNAKVFLSLDLPEAKKAAKKEADASKNDTLSTLSPAEKDALEKRRTEFNSLYTGQAAAFQKAGISFGFSSLTVKVTDIHANIRRIITAGLSEDQALAALTTTPAQLLSLSDRLGTVDNGKIANLVVSNKPYFHENAKVRYVFVDGTMYKYDTKETPKADGSAKAEIVGTWHITTATPQGKEEGSLTFTIDGSKYVGSVSVTKLSSALALETVELNGNVLKYSYTAENGGQSYKVSVEATVDGNSFKGTATAGTFGNFPIEGKKEPNR